MFSHFRDTMQLYLLMDKQGQVKHIQWMAIDMR